MFELYAGFIILFVLGLYCIVWRKNMIKKVMGLSIIFNSIHILLINMGYRSGGIPPIITPDNLNSFAVYAVDPLPQALVMTSIVINLSVTTLALGIVILAYRHFKTLDMDKLNRMRG